MDGSDGTSNHFPILHLLLPPLSLCRDRLKTFPRLRESPLGMGGDSRNLGKVFQPISVLYPLFAAPMMSHFSGKERESWSWRAASDINTALPKLWTDGEEDGEGAPWLAAALHPYQPFL